MQCPKCSEDLVTRSEGGVTVDTCTGCRGWWLDVGELNELVAASTASTTTSGPDVESTFRTGPPSTLKCPRCTGQALHFGKIARVTVDRCFGCRGLFLDWGELARIRKAVSAQGPAGAALDAEAAAERSIADAVDRYR